MSIWICDHMLPRGIACLAALALLPACLAGFGPGKAVDSIEVTRGNIAIAGPGGFCIDDATLRDRAEGAFVLLASCAAISGARSAPHPAIPGVLSVMVSAGADGVGLSAALPDIETFLTSDDGRAALSRTGDAASVTVLQSRITRGILFLNIRDDSAFDGPEIEPEYWRAILDIKGHIVTLSAMVPAGQPGNGALATLESFIARVQRDNAPPAATGTQEAAARPARSAG